MLTSDGDPAELHQDVFYELMFTYRGAEVCSAQRVEGRENLFTSFSSLGGKCYRENRPDSAWRCKAKEQDRKVTNCRQGNPKHCAILSSGWVGNEPYYMWKPRGKCLSRWGKLCTDPKAREEEWGVKLLKLATFFGLLSYFLYFKTRNNTPLSSTHEAKHHLALIMVPFQVGIGHLWGDGHQL